MKPQPYLSAKGKKIFRAIHAHCQKLGIANDIDSFELSMLANSFDLYAVSAAYCNKHGVSQMSQSGWNQTVAEYSVLKTEYANILKHSAKFGLNPADREKLLKNMKEEEDDFELNLD